MSLTAISDSRGTSFAAAARALSKPDALPALFFCSAGKGRTGLLAALLLGAVGVADHDIVADYNATERNLQGAFRSAIDARASAAGISEQELAVMFAAPAALMTEILAWLRKRHGEAAGYLLTHGLAEVELRALHRTLIRPAAATAA